MNHILIYGGTFDPPHNAHLKIACNIQKTFKFDEFYFLPCKTPLLKESSETTTSQRVDMLKLALTPYKKFKIDLREIDRDTPSFMVETLKDLRAERKKDHAITLLIGMDAFLQLPAWHEWEKLLELCNLLVINRPLKNNEQYPEPIRAILPLHLTQKKADLISNTLGFIYFYDAGLYDTSSTKIRELAESGKSIKPYVPYAVYRYIKTHHLYEVL